MTLHGYALAPGASLHDIDMGAGSVLSPLHVHDAEDEVVVVLEGRLSCRVGNETGGLDAGGLLWFPRAVPHAIANHSGRPCRFLTMVTPSGIEDFFRAQGDYLASLEPGASPDPGRLASVAGAGTRRVVGPPL